MASPIIRRLRMCECNPIEAFRCQQLCIRPLLVDDHLRAGFVRSCLTRYIKELCSNQGRVWIRIGISVPNIGGCPRRDALSCKTRCDRVFVPLAKYPASWIL